MFDWNDKELTNIIWGESGDSDDHIVPYQEGSENKEEWIQEDTTIKSTERKTSAAKIDFHGRKVESSSSFNSNERISASEFGMGSWSDLSLSGAAKTDEDRMYTDGSNNIAQITKNNSSSGEVKAKLDKDPEIFQNPHEVKDQGDFVDYSWANIGSFDDLDRIFSNDDPIFGHVNLGNADGLWSASSKDVTKSPVKSFPLSVNSPSLEVGALNNASEHVEVKPEFEQQGDQSLTLSHEKLDYHADGLQNAHEIRDHVEYPGGKSKPIVEEQGYRQKKRLKGQKLEEKTEGKLLQGLCGAWSPTSNPIGGKYGNQLAHSVLQSSPSSVFAHQSRLQKSNTLQYQQISGSFVTPSTYGNLTNPYPVMPVMSHTQAGEFKNQSLVSCYEVSPGKANSINKSPAAPAKPLTMTPQEKIEKLRRRQKMQAMLAIQRQQQQFSHQVSSTDHSISQKSQENQIHHVDEAGLRVEDLNTPFDPNSPMEQDDSNTIHMTVDNYSVDSILYRLEDVIAKLDFRIRLCIRDSLFRLAKSAMQRHYAGDTSSANRSSRDEPEVAKADHSSCSGYPRMSDRETETNPIDRTVAHLLFHSPSELFGKHPETPESHAPVKQTFPYQGFKVPEPQYLDPSEASTCIDTTQKASNYGPTDSGAADVEASQ